MVGYFETYYGVDLPNARPPCNVLALCNRNEVKPLFLPSDHECSFTCLARNSGCIDWKLSTCAPNAVTLLAESDKTQRIPYLTQWNASPVDPATARPHFNGVLAVYSLLYRG